MNRHSQVEQMKIAASRFITANYFPEYKIEDFRIDSYGEVFIKRFEKPLPIYLGRVLIRIDLEEFVFYSKESRDYIYPEPQLTEK